jgi:hypothetical protein
MAAQTKLPVSVDDQFLRRLGMIERRPVAILARYNAVQLFGADLYDIAVTLIAVWFFVVSSGLSI